MALDRQLQIRDDEVAREAHFLRQHAGIARRDALRSWRAAAYQLLAVTFSHWPAETAHRQRLIGQCVGELESMARQLFDRGWLLQEARLLEVCRTCLAPIVAAQAAGKIGDFWPYFRVAVRRFVPVHAEELQRLARREGGAVGAADVFAAIAGALARPAVTATEAIGERHAERAQAACTPPAKRGRPKKFQAAEDATGDLFSGGL